MFLLMGQLSVLLLETLIRTRLPEIALPKSSCRLCASPFVPCNCGHKSDQCFLRKCQAVAHFVHHVILTVIEHELWKIPTLTNIQCIHLMGITEDWMICHLHWLIGISLSDRLMLRAALLVLTIYVSSLREGRVISSIIVGLQKFITCSGHESLSDVCTRNKFSKPINSYWVSSWLYWFFSLLICFIFS